MKDNDESFFDRIIAGYAAPLGTVTHAFAKDRIEHGFKLRKSDKANVAFELLRNRIPQAVVDSIDFDIYFQNLCNYVNDGIGFMMFPEATLWYSPRCFGHVDCISFEEQNKLLRIHDLKTGTTPAKMEQLMGYAALFCLMYRIKPIDISYNLRIYQQGEILYDETPGEQIEEIMDIIKYRDKTAEDFGF